MVSFKSIVRVITVACGLSATQGNAAVISLDFSGVLGWEPYSLEPTAPMTNSLGSILTLETTGDPSMPVNPPDSYPGMKFFRTVAVTDNHIDSDNRLFLRWYMWFSDYNSYYSSELKLWLDWTALSTIASGLEGTTGLVSVDVSYGWYEADPNTWKDGFFFTEEKQFARCGRRGRFANNAITCLLASVGIRICGSLLDRTTSQSLSG